MGRHSRNGLSLRQALLAATLIVPAGPAMLRAAAAPAATAASGPAPVSNLVLLSPDGNIRVTFEIAAGIPAYAVEYRGKPLLAASRLGFNVNGGAIGHAVGTAQGPALSIASSATASVDSLWRPLYGQWSLVRNRFNELTVDLREGAAPGRLLRVTFRAYDEGVAFSQAFPAGGGWTNVAIASENTEFRFTADLPLRANADRAQSLYQSLRISQVQSARERPLTLAPMATEGGPYVSLAEARMVDYARTRLGPGGALTLRTALSSAVSAAAPFTTPWRVVFIADRAVDLLNHQYLIENLNPPNSLADAAWIKPGKMMRVVTSDEAGARGYIDFAANMGIQYLLWDAGWYGPEGNTASDATRAVWPINIANYIRDAKAKGVGLFLYVNTRALERQLDQILPLYRDWGVAGIKYGFVNVGSQAWTRWLHDAVRKTAEHRLLIDIHDEYVPTGFSRSYPNLLTQEGIGGDEIFPAPEQTLTFLYSRMLAGAADHTVCYFDGRVASNWTRAYQLAKPVVFYSPLQVLYWYDRPSLYRNEPELEFWKALPTTWDETRALQGEIADHIVMARRKGSEWYLGSLAAASRTLTIPLDFLGGGWYMAHIYANGASATQVRIGRYLVHSGFSLKAILPRAGGQSVRLAPATSQEIQTYRGQKPAGYQNDIAVHPDTDPPVVGLRRGPGGQAPGPTLGGGHEARVERRDGGMALRLPRGARVDAKGKVLDARKGGIRSVTPSPLPADSGDK